VRPTIPLAEWRLAIDVEATRALTAEAKFPARDCRCDDCARWAMRYRECLPSALLGELQRVGVDPAHPSDVSMLNDSAKWTLRLTFHAVGRILSGPAAWAPTSDRAAGRNYVQYSASRDPLGLAVGYLESFQTLPTWATAKGQPLIAIDLWLVLPGEWESVGG
jgi:hypothetical protein